MQEIAFQQYQEMQKIAFQHYQAGRLEEAERSLRRAIALKPNYPDAYSNLGLVLQQQGHLLDQAIEYYRRAIAIKPDHPDAYSNLGNALQEQRHLDQAIDCYHRAIAIKPDHPDAYTNLGNALQKRGHLDQAIKCYHRAIAIKPDHAEAHNDLGDALQHQGHLDEAVDCYRRAIGVRPDHADAHHNLAIALLVRGEMMAGWKEYEWRWQTSQMSPRSFAQPQWRGQRVEGKTLLIYAEQGFGDTLQFCRYAPLAAALGLRVILEVPEALVRLLRTLPDVHEVITYGKELPHFDLHCPMLTVPLALGRVDGIPDMHF